MVLDPPTKPNQVPDLKQRDVRETITTPKTETYYTSFSPAAFMSQNPDTDSFHYDEDEAYLSVDADAIVFLCPVNLPHGATITAIICYGNAGATAETWTLQRATLDAVDGDILASANFDTEDTSVGNPLVDNSSFYYYIWTSSLDTGDRIHGVRITYTL